MPPAVKAEGGQLFKAGDYAYTPDTSKPSTWKLRLTNMPGGKPDKGIVGAAVAALGKGFRGQKVQIPAGDLAAVKAKVRAAWKKANPDAEADDMPDALSEALSHSELEDQLTALLRAQHPDDDDWYPWVDDTGTDDAGSNWFVWRHKGQYFRQSFTVGENDVVTVIGDPVEVLRSTSYRPKPVPGAPAPAPAPAPTSEAEPNIHDEWVALVETSLRRDGTMPIKIIEPGWGTSGYYSSEVLERDGAAAFPSGTQMYWDHPTATEEAERPERSIRDLAATTVSDPTYQENGPAGPGLYADAKPFSEYSESLESLAPHIGLSIRALGALTPGEAEGRSGQIVERIATGKSIDFVTAPGAGGEIVQLFEAARPGATRPVPRKEPTVADDQKLTEVQKQLDDTNTKLKEAEDLGVLAAAERDRANEQLVLREARDHVVAELAKPEVKLADITKTRIAEAVASNPPIKDGALDKDALGKRLEEAVRAEVEYLAKLTGSGTVTGLGESTPAGDDAALKEAEEANAERFRRLGLSEDAAKTAAVGR